MSTLDLFVPYDQQDPATLKTKVEAVAWPSGLERANDFVIVSEVTSLQPTGVRRRLLLTSGTRFLAKNNTAALREAAYKALFINSLNMQVPTTCTPTYTD